MASWSRRNMDLPWNRVYVQCCCQKTVGQAWTLEGSKRKDAMLAMLHPPVAKAEALLTQCSVGIALWLEDASSRSKLWVCHIVLFGKHTAVDMKSVTTCSCELFFCMRFAFLWTACSNSSTRPGIWSPCFQQNQWQVGRTYEFLLGLCRNSALSIFHIQSFVFPCGHIQACLLVLKYIPFQKKMYVRACFWNLVERCIIRTHKEEIAMGTKSPRTRATKDPERGCLGYIEDEILPRYVGIIINHYKHPFHQYFMESIRTGFAKSLFFGFEMHITSKGLRNGERCHQFWWCWTGDIHHKPWCRKDAQTLWMNISREMDCYKDVQSKHPMFLSKEDC